MPERPRFGALPPLLRELFSRVFVPEPRGRATLEELAAHPWVTGGAGPVTPPPPLPPSSSSVTPAHAADTGGEERPREAGRLSPPAPALFVTRARGVGVPMCRDCGGLPVAVAGAAPTRGECQCSRLRPLSGARRGSAGAFAPATQRSGGADSCGSDGLGESPQRLVSPPAAAGQAAVAPPQRPQTARPARPQAPPPVADSPRARAQQRHSLAAAVEARRAWGPDCRGGGAGAVDADAVLLG